MGVCQIFGSFRRALLAGTYGLRHPTWYTLKVPSLYY